MWLKVKLKYLSTNLVENGREKQKKAKKERKEIIQMQFQNSYINIYFSKLFVTSNVNIFKMKMIKITAKITRNTPPINVNVQNLLNL